MKKKLLLLILCLIFFANHSLAASGSLGAGSSKPANISIYYPYRLSDFGVWDLNELTNKDNAIVAEIKVEFDLFSSIAKQKYDGLNIFLSNQQQEVKLELSKQGVATTDTFKGDQLSQEWKLRYFVEALEYEGNYFALTPKLSIIYKNN